MIDNCLGNSGAFDSVGASAAGMLTAWADRSAAPFDGIGRQPDITVPPSTGCQRRWLSPRNRPGGGGAHDSRLEHSVSGARRRLPTRGASAKFIGKTCGRVGRIQVRRLSSNAVMTIREGEALCLCSTPAIRSPG
jgi:hypothetical protein